MVEAGDVDDFAKKFGTEADDDGAVAVVEEAVAVEG